MVSGKAVCFASVPTSGAWGGAWGSSLRSPLGGLPASWEW